MSETTNNAILVGELARAPSFRAARTGLQIAEVLVRVGAKNNEPVHATAVLFGGLADKLKATPPGTRVAIAGRLEARSYQDRNGQERHSLELVAHTVLVESAPAPAAPEWGADEGASAF